MKPPTFHAEFLMLVVGLSLIFVVPSCIRSSAPAATEVQP